MNSPHTLTPADYRMLVSWVTENIVADVLGVMRPDEIDTDAARELAHQELDVAWIAKFEYMSDGPGYSGPVFVIVFPAGPESHVVLIERDGELQVQERGTDHLPKEMRP